MRLTGLLALALLTFAPGPALARPPASRSVSLDEDWLKRHGPPPYVLDQPGTTYVLRTGVRARGTAFVVNAPDVVLDLNGHVVVYGDTPPITVANGGFEEGKGKHVPGWDVTEAPAAQLAPNTNYLFGKQVLRFKDVRTKQRFVSAPVAVRSGPHDHVATITPARGDYRSRLELRVLDADTRAVLGRGVSNNVERGMAAVAHFRPGKSESVRLEVEFTPAPGRASSLDLDHATVAVAHDHGVIASNAWSGEIPGWNNVGQKVGKRAGRVANFTLRNGTVRQGGRGFGSSPLFGRQVGGIRVEGVETFTAGMDTSSVDLERASGRVEIRRCVLRHDVDNISDRGKSFAALRLLGINGPVRVEHNRLVNVPQIGILLDGARYGHPVLIRHNHVHQNAAVCNGYGLIVAGSRNFEIAHNRIIADNGRGIDVDSYRRDPVVFGHLHHNHVEVRERLNREYYARLEARALRLRNTVDYQAPHHDLLIRDNTFIARTGDGLAQKAFAVRVSYLNAKGSMSRANVRLENNLLKAVTTSADPESRASALALDGLASGVELAVRDNVLESNDTSLTLADSEGSVEDLTFVGNTFRRSDEGDRRAYHAVQAGYWQRTLRNVAVVGSRLENGATMSVRWGGVGRKDLGTGPVLKLLVRDGQRPVGGAEVSVHGGRGEVVFTGKTNEAGEIDGVPLVTRRHRQLTPDSRRITVEECGPFRVQVRAAWKTVSRPLPTEASTTVTVDLASP